ncbi:MAG: superoxide dismutase family protein [Terriglobales bacterium]
MKHKRFFIAAVSSAILLWSLSSAAKTVVEMKDAQGNSVGTITLSESGTGAKGTAVGLDLDLHGLPPGTHAIHFHQTAKCDPPDFKSAGPHFNPDGKKHGLQNPEGHHAGDMFNFSVTQQGIAKLKLTDTDVVLGDGTNRHSLFSNGGTAIVIHADPDDMKTDPAGNSGPRIACGIVSK